MPLVKSTLEQQLKSAFKNMSKMSAGGDEYLASQIGNAIQSYVSSGDLSTTTDIGVGVAPPGPYTGVTVSGKMSVVGVTIASLLIPIFKSMGSMVVGGDEYFATQFGIAVNTAFMSAICSGTSTGTTLVPPFAIPTPTVVPITGVVVGVPTIITGVLLPALKLMSNMPDGGDDYLASQMATSIDTYIKSLVITVMGTAPATFVSKGTLS